MSNGMDSFLVSMTFAGTGAHRPRGGCNCDECGGAGGLLPQAIIDAIRAHKRLKAETGPLRRTQQRELLLRQGAISVYRLTMPLHSEPLVEFGSAHRLVWVQKLSEHSQLLSIGKGIVGSQDEERGRQELNDWKQGDIFLVPSNGGKAIAWIHTTGTNSTQSNLLSEENEDASSSSSVHAIIIICKIPKNARGETSTTDENNEQSTQELPQIVADTCDIALQKFINNNTANDKGMQYQKLSGALANRLREALSKL